MVARHRGSNDEKDRHSTTKHRNMEYWADALAVQSRVDQKDDGNSGPSSHVPRGSSPAGVAPYSQVVSFTDVPCVRYLDGGGTRGQGPAERPARSRL